MKNYDLIIFDLIDTLAYCEGLSEHTLRLEQSLGKKTVEEFIDGGNIDTFRSVAEAIRKFKSITPLTMEEEEAVHDWLSWSKIFLFSDSVEILEFLKNEGYKIGVISNSPPTPRDQLSDLGIKHYIDEVIFSFEVGYRKPEKEIFLTMLEGTGVDASRALMIGDSIKYDINAARAVGIDALLLDRQNTSETTPKITNLSELKAFLT